MALAHGAQGQGCRAPASCARSQQDGANRHGLYVCVGCICVNSGELSMYFAEDLGLVKLGQAPADSLRAVFDAQATACLCAGSRDLVLQRCAPP